MTLPAPAAGPADRRTRGGHVNANIVPHGGGAGRVRADDVTLDQTGGVDVNAVERISGDDVAGAGGCSADRAAAGKQHVDAVCAVVRDRASRDHGVIAIDDHSCTGEVSDGQRSNVVLVAREDQAAHAPARRAAI